MKNKKKILFTFLFIFVLTFSSCGYINNIINKWTSNLIGTHFVIRSFDVYGNNIFTMEGNKVSVSLFDEKEINSTSNKNINQSKVLEITIDGKQVIHVGSTLVFAEKGIDIIEDFDVQTQIKSESGITGITSVNRFLNFYKNKIGKPQVIIIRTQQGLPIGIYQGKNINVEVDEELPTFTRISIDGKSLYIYRADYTIIDSSLVK